MNALFSAFAFLTVLRVPDKWTGGEKGLSNSVWFFPVVGIFIGGVCAGVGALLGDALPAWPLAIVLVMISAAICGGLHMDGLADTADGFFSSRPRGRILEIMHDSRIGTMGVLALIFSVALKVSVLATLAGRDPLLLLQAAFLMPLAGRCSLVLSMAVTPYAREEGLATLFWHRSPARLIWTLSILALLGWRIAELRGIMAVGAAVVSTILFAGYCYRKIGGGTGDTLGAGNEIAEVVTGVMFLVLSEGVGG